MKIKITAKILKHMQSNGCKSDEVERQLRWADDDSVQELSLDKLPSADAKSLSDLLRTKFADDPCATQALRRFATYAKLKTEVASQPIGRLDTLETALKNLLKPTPNKWLFEQNSDGQMLAYYASDIRFSPRDSRNPATTRMKLWYSERGEKKEQTVTWKIEQLAGRKTVVQLLADRGYYVETKEQVEDYKRELEVYLATYHRTGAQMLGTGVAFSFGDRYWSSTETSLDRDGEKSKLVIDDLGDEDSSNRDGCEYKSRSTSTVTHADEFWSKGIAADDDRDDDDADETEANVVVLPVHPYVKAFKLDAHKFVHCHVNNLSEYVWDKSLIKKLVLNSEAKTMIEDLVVTAGDLMEDIVKGKTGGVIVASSGPPGVGKTLTAEVYGETIMRPLYTVQCSQLGTDEEVIERKLTLTLTRAMRWGAILLIDEADVYVAERGRDIQQNAIVGVFLRTLERYRGILFLTTNRATCMDDAIVSRLTAHVRYQPHTRQELVQIWSVLSVNYKVGLDAGLLDSLAERFPKISGRGIKNMLKLVRVVAARHKRKPSLEMFEAIAKFQDVGEDAA